MSDTFDFERYWLTKFGDCLEAVGGPAVRQQVLQGSQVLSDDTPRAAVISWTQEAVQRMGSVLDEEQQKQVMTGCACRYPKENLQDMRRTYAETGDIRLVHQMLLDQFASFLRNTLELSEEMTAEILDLGWGAAGVLQADRIIATKIPKSGNLTAYLEETDREQRRRDYCHCPRVRAALETEETIPPIYCYCGAGFYRGIWEEILGQPVRVEVLETVLGGGDVCRIAVHLPVG